LLGVRPDRVRDGDALADLIPDSEEEGVHYWSIPRSVLGKKPALDAVSERVSATFGIATRQAGDTEAEAVLSAEDQTALFDLPGAAAAYQKQVNTVEQVTTAVTGTPGHVTVKKDCSRWEHSVYFSVNGEETAGMGIFFGDWKPNWTTRPATGRKMTS